MSVYNLEDDITITDLTRGISASTSPMAPLRKSKPNEVIDLLMDSSDDEEKKEEYPARKVSRPSRNCRRDRQTYGKEVGCVTEKEDNLEKDILKKDSEEQKSSSAFSDTKFEKLSADGRKIEAYLRARRSGVKKRSFDLNRIPKSEVIPTGRTIKRMNAWTGHWPALREFMQNTIDHLGLLDSRTGRRHEALHLDVEAAGCGGQLATFRFMCKEESVCTIEVFRDELIIEQLYTFPIAPRALDTGVPDMDKSTEASAGGFGDGFKTAAVALLALGKDFESLEWKFDAQGQHITWSFEGACRAAVGRFAKCSVLQVRIDRMEKSTGEESDVKENVMQQLIKVKGIGKSFIEKTVPRLIVFWDLDDSALIASRKTGGDFIAKASVQPPIAKGALGSNLKPESGVYVRGIWVRTSKITGTLMCFFGKRLEVTGRDRNEVEDDQLLSCVVYVFRHCSNMSYLQHLMKPLRGIAHDNVTITDSGNSSSSSRKADTRGTRCKSSSSWLLVSPRFLNRIFEEQKDFILYDVLNVPPGSIFVSSKTTKSADPFIKWASAFLKNRGAPIEPIETGANRYLFQEVNELELTEKCVEMLKADTKEKGGDSEMLSVAFKKLFAFMGLGRARVYFSPHISVAFVHDRNIYVPVAALTRELIVKVLNVCQCHLDRVDNESFSSLMQAIFETLSPGETNIDSIGKAVKRAKDVHKENTNFMVNPSTSTGTSKPNKSASKKKMSSPHVEDLTDDFAICDKGNDGRKKRLSSTSAAELQQQIERINRSIRDKGEKLKNRNGTDLPPIISEADFGCDDSGHDSCLRPSSSLQNIPVGFSLGGGALLCDQNAADAIKNGKWSTQIKARIASLRNVLGEATDIVRKGIPSLDSLLERIRPGYDSSNDTYEAFCDGTQIIVNLHAYMPKLRCASPSGSHPQTLVHDFVIMITHELAHFLEPRAGHGPVWRDTHMKMIIEIMVMMSANNSNHTNTSDSSRAYGTSSNKRPKRS
eukprot:CAMPEP_0195525508 /NCGR_PEP_ID=MMETSP0794_2-20130614/25991_1 /TAXON_ID=515487 /ORGANISM="Stephanopyxis turris, Strain CCMP 815" /LENGTH=990 /DNA_ID=CAMNT_0040655987 /DNA_START=150 /DNA_END=3122 /DNA_ORIENTATION=+